MTTFERLAAEAERLGGALLRYQNGYVIAWRALGGHTGWTVPSVGGGFGTGPSPVDALDGSRFDGGRPVTFRNLAAVAEELEAPGGAAARGGI